jgi:hypothetical protein
MSYRIGEKGVAAYLVALFLVTYLVMPPDACAVEVGCFCTFIFVSTLFMTGVACTLFGKYQLGRKIWKLSLKRTIGITALEVILLVAVLFLLQVQYYLRMLAYLPLAFLLNYSLTSRHADDPAADTMKKRATMAALSSVILPITVQIIAWVSITLSEWISFKEVRI